MATYTITKTGNFDEVVLQAEVNSDSSIGPSCIAIDAYGQVLTFDFGSNSLTTPEETQLGVIVTNHIPPTEEIGVNQLPYSTLDGKKLAVHNSTKPEIDNVTYAVWVGRGDHYDDLGDVYGDLGGGDPLVFNFAEGISGTEKSIELRFNPIHGRVWIHEAYLRFEGGGPTDSIEATVVAEGTPLQQVVNLDLVVDDDDYISYSLGGPGTGTHGFADASRVQLIPRTFSHDGAWDYDEINGLTPNFTNTGDYKMASVDKPVHRYYDSIPCAGTCPTYFTMSSDETAELKKHYYVRVTAHNNHDNTWHASVIVELFRERTLEE